MRRILIAVAAGAAVTACATPSSGQALPAPSSPASSVTTPVKAAVSAETIQACRELAEDVDLKAFWSWVANTRPPLPPDERQLRALSAVTSLGRSASGPRVDPAVASTVRVAASSAAGMKDQWVKSGTLDVERFRALITPIVAACQAQDIDMSVPG